MSYNPEKLEELGLFLPRLMTSGMTLKASETAASVPVPMEQDNLVSDENEKVESGIGKFTTPKGLKVGFHLILLCYKIFFLIVFYVLWS